MLPDRDLEAQRIVIPGISVGHRLHLVYTVYSQNVLERLDAFRESCTELNVDLVEYDAGLYDASNVPQLGSDDLVYRMSRGGQALEALLLQQGTSSCYLNRLSVPVNWIDDTVFWSLIYEREGLPCPRSVVLATTDRKIIESAVLNVGGFPLIVKTTGGSVGIGVMRVDSWEALVSLLDYLLPRTTPIILRKFIPHRHAVRAYVIGSTVVDCFERLVPEGDFRSNARQPGTEGYSARSPITLTSEVEAVCIQAVLLAGVECGGLDLIADARGQYHIIEMNFPFGFLKSDGHLCTRLLRHLVSKSLRTSGLSE